MSAFNDQNLVDTIGAETIGIGFALFLGGVVFQQTYRYFATYPGDRWQFKFLVTILAILNLCHSAALMHTLNSWDVTQ